jgi:hypothetical protein
MYVIEHCFICRASDSLHCVGGCWDRTQDCGDIWHWQADAPATQLDLVHADVIDYTPSFHLHCSCSPLPSFLFPIIPFPLTNSLLTPFLLSTSKPHSAPSWYGPGRLEASEAVAGQRWCCVSWKGVRQHCVLENCSRKCSDGSSGESKNWPGKMSGEPNTAWAGVCCRLPWLSTPLSYFLTFLF